MRDSIGGLAVCAGLCSSAEACKGHRRRYSGAAPIPQRHGACAIYREQHRTKAMAMIGMKHAYLSAVRVRGP